MVSGLMSCQRRVGMLVAAAAVIAVTAAAPAAAASWKMTSVAMPSGAAGLTRTQIQGVSCPTRSWCASFGQYMSNYTVLSPLMEVWNGTSWAIQSAENPISE
jgi:hypothetical protein